MGSSPFDDDGSPPVKRDWIIQGETTTPSREFASILPPVRHGESFSGEGGWSRLPLSCPSLRRDVIALLRFLGRQSCTSYAGSH